MFGVAMSDPKQPSCANPTSSRTMTTTLGAPSGGRTRSGHDDSDSARYRPMVPPKSRRSPIRRFHGARAVAHLPEDRLELAELVGVEELDEVTVEAGEVRAQR